MFKKASGKLCAVNTDCETIKSEAALTWLRDLKRTMPKQNKYVHSVSSGYQVSVEACGTLYNYKMRDLAGKFSFFIGI